MSTAIGPNPYSRQWRPPNEHPTMSDERMRDIYQYQQCLRGELSKKIKRSYLFVEGMQVYDEHFQRVFRACFAQMRGGAALIKDASHTLMLEFDHFPDVCSRLEVPFYEGTGAVSVSVINNPHSNLQKKLQSILDRTRGLQQALLMLLEQEGKKLLPKLKTDEIDCFLTDHFCGSNGYVFYPAALVLSTILPKCSDVFKDILSQLLQLAWLEEQLPTTGNSISPPLQSHARSIAEFPFRGVQYVLAKTNDDGACALHALLGEPVNDEYCYPGPGNVRELFSNRLEKHMQSSPAIRTMVTNIIYSHLDRPDASSEILFAGKAGQALRIAYCLSSAGVDQFIRKANQAEASLWQLQMSRPHIRKHLLAAAKTNRRYAKLKKEEILRKLEEYPDLILSLVNESPTDFLRLPDGAVYWKILDIRSQRQECLEWAGINRKLFAINQLYPHYLEAIKDPRYFFNTQELELAAILFEKKMQVIQLLNGHLGIATDMINAELPGDPIIIFHAGVHFSRCRPKEQIDTAGALYQEAELQATALTEWDEKASNRLVSTIKDEALHLSISGGVSLFAKSPLPIYGQLVRTLTNVFGAKVDPFNQHKGAQAAKLLVNSAGCYALGGGSLTQLGKALAIDAWATMAAPANMSRTEASERSFYVPLLKSLGGSDKEMLDSVVSGILSAGSTLITPEEKEGEGWGRRILRAIPTNCDLHKTLQDLAVKSLEAPPKKTTGGELEDKLKDCEKRAQEMEDEVSSLKAKEERAAEERREAKVQAIKKLSKILREELTEIKEQGLEDEWLGKFVPEGLKKAPESEIEGVPLGKGPKQGITETPEKLKQRIGQAVEELTDLDAAIDIGKQHVKNLEEKCLNTEEATIALNIAEERQSELIQGLQEYCHRLQQADPTVDLKALIVPKQAQDIPSAQDSHEQENVPPIPVINLEVQRHIEITEQELGKERAVGIEKDAGVAEAEKKLREKFRKKQKVEGKKKSKPADIEKAETSHAAAADNFNNFKRERDLHKANKIDALETKLSSLKERLYAPTEEQDYLNRVADQQHYWGQSQRQLNEKILADRQAVAAVAETAMLKKFEAYNKKGNGLGLSPGNKEFNAYWEARQKYEAAANDVNQAKANLNLKQEHPFEKFVKDPPKRGPVEKAYDATSGFLEKIGFSGGVNVYTTAHPEVKKPSSAESGESLQTSSSYHETRHQISLERSELAEMEVPAKKALPQTYNWGPIQEHETQKILDTNMAFKSPSDPTRLDYSPLKDLGVQLPPSNTAQALQSGTRKPETARASRLPLQMAGVLPFAISQAVPEQMQKKIATWVKGYIQQWKDDPIKAKQDLDICLILGAKKATVAAIQAFEQPSLKSRPNTISLMDVSDRCDRVVAQIFNVNLESPNAQMGVFIGELAMPLPLVAKAKPVMKVGQEAFAFMRQSSKLFKPLSMRAAVVNPRMTMTRPLLIQEASAKHMTAQRAFLERVNNPVYRSGVVGKETVAKLTDRSIRQIDPLKLPTVKPGPELDWLSVNAPKIRQLQIIKGKDFDRFIKSTFKDQSLTEQKIRRLLNFSGFETYPRPIGLPDNIVVEFAKKNGGMIYRKLGTTEDQNLVVRVCPGLGKESVVASTIKGRVDHGTLRQQTPYVVQRKDKEFLRTDGTWTIKKKDPLTHLPLETYEFKGWE